MSFIYIYFVTNCQGLHTKLKRLFLKIIFLWFYFFCHFVQSLMVKGNSFTKVNWFVHIAQILCLMFIELMSLPIPQFSGSHCNSLSIYGYSISLDPLDWRNFMKIFLLKSRNLDIGLLSTVVVGRNIHYAIYINNQCL